MDGLASVEFTTSTANSC